MANQVDQSLDIADEPATAGFDVADEGPGGNGTVRDDDGTPYCRKHHCRMRAYSNGTKGSRKSYYRCPIKGCEEKGIKVQQPKRIPQHPQACPRCERAGRTVYCVRDADLAARGVKKRRQPGMVVLACPECLWTAPPLADPRIAAFELASRTRGTYGDR